MQNSAASKLFSLLGDPEEVWREIGDDGSRNLALLSVHPNGLRRYIQNWDDIAPPFYQRLKRESMDALDPSAMETLLRLKQFLNIEDIDKSSNSVLIPILPLEISYQDIRLSLCSVISTFGTAQDITANELKIETFYPADKETELQLELLGSVQ